MKQKMSSILFFNFSFYHQLHDARFCKIKNWYSACKYGWSTKTELAVHIWNKKISQVSGESLGEEGKKKLFLEPICRYAIVLYVNTVFRICAFCMCGLFLFLFWLSSSSSFHYVCAIPEDDVHSAKCGYLLITSGMGQMFGMTKKLKKKNHFSYPFPPILFISLTALLENQ